MATPFDALNDPNKPPQQPQGQTGNPFAAVGGTQAASPTQPMPPMPTQSASAPAAGAFDPNKVWGDLSNQFQTKHGRAMTGEEATALQKYAGYTGGAIDQGMIDKAGQGINAYTGNLANPFGPAATTGAAPAAPAPVDPAAGTNTLVQEQIQQLLKTGNTDAMSNVDMSNPAITAQRTAFDRANARATGRERLAAAERNAARGTLGAGGFDAELAGIESGAGDRQVNFESQMLRGELTDQRNRVMQAMQMAMQSGDNASARAMQERLGMIDNQLRREGMTMQNKLGQGQLGLGLLSALLGDKRAGDSLGLGYAQLGQQANSQLLNAIMGL